MNNKKLKKYLNKIYWKNKQHLKLKGWVDVEAQKLNEVYTSQEVYINNVTFIDIQTWSVFGYNYDLISYTPYCEKATEWTGYVITVPKFGQLTDEDIDKAITYTLHRINEDACDDIWLMVWNIEFDGRRIEKKINNRYTLDSVEIREWNNLDKLKRCVRAIKGEENDIKITTT